MNKSYSTTLAFDLQHDDPSKDERVFLMNDFLSFPDETGPTNICEPKCSNASHRPALVTSSKPIHNEERERLHKERDDSVFRNHDLEKQVTELQIELEACQSLLEHQRRKHEKQLDFLLNDHFQTRKSPLGPVNRTLEVNDWQVGPYLMGSRLGSGFNAEVFQSVHRITKQKYAIKRIPKEKIKMHQLEQEIMVLSQVHHPNVIQMHEVFHAPNAVYMVLELGYQDLHTFAESTGITQHSLREIAIGIVSPLAFLHEIGICHLDIKPENVMVMKNVNMRHLKRQHIKLCDFGLCTISSSANDSEVHQRSLKGTPGFFAPEQVDGPFDAKPADMWSVGCTLLELSEGLPQPWLEAYELYRKNKMAFLQGVEKCLAMIRDPDYFADVNVFDIVSSLLQMEPKRRPTASVVLTHDWFLDDYTQWRSLSDQQDVCQNKSCAFMSMLNTFPKIAL